MKSESEMPMLLRWLFGAVGLILLVGGGFCSFTSLLFISVWQISLITLPIALGAGYVGWLIVRKLLRQRKEERLRASAEASATAGDPKS